jgi:hypothetical protein
MIEPRCTPLLLAAVLIASLSACQRGESAQAPAAATAETETSAAQASSSTAAGQEAVPAPVPASGANSMEKTCGGATFRIVDDAADGTAESRTTTLQLVRGDGTTSTIEKPEEMREYTAVGLGCAEASSDGQPYFVVQYGELPFGCQFCEWFYLYDVAGKQLTKSDPPILTDASLPEGEQQTANTREYEEAVLRLDVEQPAIEVIH